MGTEIVDTEGVYVKRFFGGRDEGVCFHVEISKRFSQQELAILLGDIMRKLVVSGEGLK